MRVWGDLAREASTAVRHEQVWHKLQREASSRPGSQLVETPYGSIWMSPIEAKLYEAMRAEGLSPAAQFCVEGYYADFAFPDLRLAVEADGQEFHSGERRARDRKRDWILKNAGWSVMRFHGKTIHSRAPNCAYVVKREVEKARAEIAQREAAAASARKARNDAILRPFRLLVGFFRRKATKVPTPAPSADPARPPGGP